MKVALLTGGGDCPGLNAVIRSIPRGAVLWLSSIEQKGSQVRISGFTQRGENIPDLLSNLAATGYFFIASRFLPLPVRVDPRLLGLEPVHLRGVGGIAVDLALLKVEAPGLEDTAFGDVLVLGTQKTTLQQGVLVSVEALLDLQLFLRTAQEGLRDRDDRDADEEQDADLDRDDERPPRRRPRRRRWPSRRQRRHQGAELRSLPRDALPE